MNLAQQDPALFIQRFPPPVLIDEIQYAPQLLPYIKMSVDRDRQSGMFWLTGSPQFHIMKGISESLAGRVGIVQLLGFSRQEAIGRSNMVSPFLPISDMLQDRVRKSDTLYLKELFELIWRGAFPAISLDTHMDRDFFYSSYVQTYLQRDVRDLWKDLSFGIQEDRFTKKRCCSSFFGD